MSNALSQAVCQSVLLHAGEGHHEGLMAPFVLVALRSRANSKRYLVASPSEMPCLVAISSTALRVRCVTLAFTDAVNSGVLMSKHPLNWLSIIFHSYPI